MVENALILDEATENCTIGSYFQFFVESDVKRLVFDISGNGVLNSQLKITDKNGQNVAYTTQFQDTGAAVLIIGSIAAISKMLKFRSFKWEHGWTLDFLHDFKKWKLFPPGILNEESVKSFCQGSSGEPSPSDSWICFR